MHVDAEFAALCPPLAREEYAELEASILAEGCRDALMVWREEGILLDGHNRKRICDEHGLPFRTTEQSFSDRDAATEWVLRNQLGRRNLAPDAASLMRGRLYNMQKRGRGGTGANQYTEQIGKSCPSATAERLAEQLGVSERTIRNDGAFAEAVETLKPYVPDIAERAMTGDIPSRKAVVEAAKEPEAATHQLISQSNSNEWYTPREYIEAARVVMGDIDLDPATCETAQKWIQARTYHTEETDGLAHDWSGRVWLNPPWGRATPAFIDKLMAELNAGHVTECIVLVNAHATDTGWFSRLWDGLLCFTDHRINYISPHGPKSGSTHGSVFVYFGSHSAEFIREFDGWGAIVARVAGT